MPDALPLLYTTLAVDWYHLLTPPDEYVEEAAFYLGCFRDAATGPLETLLELGSGGGNMALHYKQHVRATLTDLSPEMLQLSQTINPELPHIQGDMRTLRLNQTFDAVFVHDAVMYLTTEADLRLAMETAFVHLRPGGVAVFAPDFVQETFKPSTDHGGHDGPDGRALRYLEWTTDPDPTDTEVTTDFVYVLREDNSLPRTIVDRHTVGLFSREVWRQLLTDVGFENVTIRPLIHPDVEAGDVEVFTAVRPIA